jgi:hypothetical protein
MSETLEFVQEMAPGILLADGLNDALIGICHQFGRPAVAAYDSDKIIEILMSQSMTHEEAMEYFSFNIEGAWVGEYTPVFIATPPR